MPFIIYDDRADTLYSKFLEWQMGVDDVHTPTLSELVRRERATFAHWLTINKEKQCVH